MMIYIYGCVPDSFGCGLIIPRLKDKLGCINSVDNYRHITLIPVLAKLFELVILDICSNYLCTDEVQQHMHCHPRNRWVDQIWNDNNLPAADLSRRAVSRGQVNVSADRRQQKYVPHSV